MTQALSIAPQGFWMKTHFYREGDHLCVVAYSCIAGSPEIFRFSVDIRPIIAAVVRAHNQLHADKVSGEELDALVGFGLSDIGNAFKGAAKGVAKSVSNAVSSPGNALKAAAQLAVSPASVMNRAFETIPGVTAAREAVMNKIHPQMNAAYGTMLGASTLSLKQISANKVAAAGKAALVSQVSSAVKGAVGNAAGKAVASAVSFPKVSMPAVGAFGSAMNALNAIKQANSAVAAAKKIVNPATSPASKAALKAGLSKWAGSTVKTAVANKTPVPAGMSIMAQAVKLTTDKAAVAKKNLATVAAKAKAGDVAAKQMARVVTLAKSNQDKLDAIKKSTAKAMPQLKGKAPVSSNLNGFPALLISASGKIVPGRYVEKVGAPKALILRGGKVLRGSFSAVAGDLDDLISGDDFGSIGCSNPFTKPSHAR